MKTLFLNKTYALTLVLAIFVGFIYVLPNLLIRHSLHQSGKPYVTVQSTNSYDDILLYIPRGRDIYDGHFPPSDSSSDAGGAPDIMPWLPQMIFAGLIAVFRTINTAYLGAVFLFSALSFVLLKKLGNLIFQKDHIWSYFFAFAGIFTTLPIQFSFAFRSINNFLNIMIKDFLPVVRTPLDKFFFVRMDYPLLTFPFLIIALVALLIFWQRPNKKTALFAAFFICLTAYVYFHFFGFLIILSGLLVAYLLFNFKKNSGGLKTIMTFAGAGFVTSLPFFLSYLKFINSPISQEYLRRVSNTEYGQNFRWLIEAWPIMNEYLLYLVLTVAIYVVFYRLDKNKKLAIFYWFSVLTMVLVWNIQLVIGFLPDPQHWLKPFSFILFMLTFHALYIIYRRLNHIKFITRIVSMVLLIFIASMFAKKIVNAAFFIHPDELTLSSYSFDPDIVDSWNWINKNLEHEPKIVSNSFLTTIYLNTYTSARSYLPIGNISLISNSEIKKRFLTANKIFEVPVDTFKSYLIPPPLDQTCEKCITNEMQNKVIFSVFLDYRIAKLKEKVIWYNNPERLENLIFQYIDMPEVKFSEIESDYIYYGPWERAFSNVNFDDNPNVELIFSNSGVSIYKVLSVNTPSKSNSNRY